MKLELDRLCKLAILKKVNHSEWQAPTFIIPKKDGTVRFISDFRKLNKRIKRYPFPLPKIQDLLLTLGGFQWATTLDLNMGYYHIELDLQRKKYCTIVLPWGKYEYQKLPMGLCNSPDIFQEKMSQLFQDLEYIREYIDDLLITTNDSFLDHLQKLDKVFTRLTDAGLKINAKKSIFGAHQVEYLGYLITRQGIQPQPNKICAIHQLAPPKTRRQLRGFVGLVNFYRDMAIRRSDILTPLTALTSTKVPFVWTDIHQKAFQKMKLALSEYTILQYPDFSKSFQIHTDASKTQLGAVISQDDKPIAFYSRKLNPAQVNYTTQERELLSIVETLKEFRNILLGQEIIVYTDHKNLTTKNFTSERVMRWRLILEEYGPTLHHIPGEKNIVADALSRLDFTPPPAFKTSQHEILAYQEQLATLQEELNDPDLMPVEYRLISKCQQHDHALLALLRTKPLLYQQKTVHEGGNTVQLICHKDKIVIPVQLQQKVINWYHVMLVHPGADRTEQTIGQHFYWKGMQKDIRNFVSRCPTCQKYKIRTKKYGHLPAKQAEIVPWEKLCVDLIGPYTIPNKLDEDNPRKLWCVTMIDPATGWVEIKDIENKQSSTIANIVEQTWIMRYPWPKVITYDQGKEFLGDFAQMVRRDYGIKMRPITVRNPQANLVVERVHQTIGNMLKTFKLYDKEDWDEEDPWSGILTAVMFGLRATYHTTPQASPMQLIFNRDAILNVKFHADWKFIKDRKQKLINANNRRENRKCVNHVYQVNDQVMAIRDRSLKHGEPQYNGPYCILEVRNNRTVKVQTEKYTQILNIRQVFPYTA